MSQVDNHQFVGPLSGCALSVIHSVGGTFEKLKGCFLDFIEIDRNCAQFNYFSMIFMISRRVGTVVGDRPHDMMKILT
jgi:hypothetical protein